MGLDSRGDFLAEGGNLEKKISYLGLEFLGGGREKKASEEGVGPVVWDS